MILSLGHSARGLAQWQSLNGGVSHSARSFALSLDSTRLLVGGSFPYLNNGSVRANNLAWWDGASWSLDGLDNGSGDTTTYGNSSPVFSLAVRPDTIFASNFNTEWHLDSNMALAAMLAGGNWQTCGSPEGIFFFLEANGRLFGGGQMSFLNGAEAYGVQEWRGGWQQLPNMPFTSGVVQVWDVEYWHGQYYFGGAFNYQGSQKVVAFDGVDQWSPLGDGLGGSWVQSVCGYGDSLYAGGYMLNGTNIFTRHLQIWDGSGWLPFFDEFNVTGKITDMKVYDGDLYIAGGFALNADTSQYGLLRYDGHQLCALGGYTFNGGQPFTFFNGDLYMGKGAADPPYGEHIGYLDLATVQPDTCVLVTPNTVRERSTDNNTLRLFPNPTHEEVTIQLPPHWTGAVPVIITDALGRVVLRTAATDRKPIDVSNLPQGLYRVCAVQHETTACGELQVL